MVSWPGDTFKLHPGFETRHPADWRTGLCLQHCSSGALQNSVSGKIIEEIAGENTPTL